MMRGVVDSQRMQRYRRLGRTRSSVVRKGRVGRRCEGFRESVWEQWSSDREVDLHSLATKSACTDFFFFLKWYLQRLQKAKKLMKQSKQEDYYKIVGVSRDADLKTIKKAL